MFVQSAEFLASTLTANVGHISIARTSDRSFAFVTQSNKLPPDRHILQAPLNVA